MQKERPLSYELDDIVFHPVDHAGRRCDWFNAWVLVWHCTWYRQANVRFMEKPMSYASDVQRDEKIDRMEEALRKIQRWAHAYPVDIFRPVSDEDLQRAHAALVAIGLSNDRLHAAWARHILTGIDKLCAEGLNEIQ